MYGLETVAEAYDYELWLEAKMGEHEYGQYLLQLEEAYVPLPWEKKP
jgi:hypothetical protein